jgi:hypothetical protein
MRTTLILDDDAYQIAVRLASASHKGLGQVISDLIRRGVQTTERSGGRQGESFPVFELPVGTPMISLKAIRRAWQGE